MKTAIAILAVFICAAASAQTTQPSGGFTVTQWAVFVIDASQQQMNPEGMVVSTLPYFIDTQRSAVPGQAAPSQSAGIPMPISVIRISGQADSSIDVSVEKLNGSFMASWPKAEERTKQLLWRNLKLSDQPPASGLQPAPEGGWYAGLRAVPSGYLSQDNGQAERFLIYDAEKPCESPIKAIGGRDYSVQLENIGIYPLHNLMLYQVDHGTWRQAEVGEWRPRRPRRPNRRRPPVRPRGRLQA